MVRCARLIKNGIALFGVVLATPAAAAQAAAAPPVADTGGHPRLSAQAELHTRVKYFDFDERKLGNYEDTPMHWVQQRGDGLPVLFARGRIDDEVGRSAPPSFRLDIATGNVAYEYQHLDLTVVPGCDYSLIGYVRAEQLTFAGAFAAAYFVDRFGEPISGSHSVSRIVRATGRDPEPWQRVMIDLPGNLPEAYALRLQFWIMQDHVWHERAADDIDPIVRRDVYASAWFDDFSVYRLPRVGLHLSDPAGLVAPGRRESIILDVSNATSQPLRVELTITDQTGELRHFRTIDVPPIASPANLAPGSATASGASSGDLTLAGLERRHITAWREPLPDLAPGFYSARLRVLGGTESLLTRRTNFAVLPRLPEGQPPFPDLGVDLGRWQRSDPAGAVGLLAELGCGAVKIGVPMVGNIEGQERTAYFRQLSALVRALGENRVDTTGVILAPQATGGTAPDSSARALVSRGDTWRRLLGPVLAHFGALMPTWQLGAEQIELRGGQLWEPAEVEAVRRHLGTFVSIPRLAVPRPLTAVPPAGEDITSVWIPRNIPTRTLPRLLDFLVSNDPSSYWLQLAPSADEELSGKRRMDDVVRRLVLAKALGPGRVYLPAPFELSEESGQLAWQPTEDYVVYRTLFHFLSGKTAAAALTPVAHTLGIVFHDPDSSCLVIWSWQDDPPPEPVELYLGPHPRAVTIWGERQALEVVDGRTRIPVGPTPLIVEALHTPLALLQASYRVVPTYVQSHKRRPRPVVTFRNTFDSTLSGEVRLTPPKEWRVKPAQRSFALQPGEVFAEPMTLTLPPRQVAQTQNLDVHLILHSPEAAELHFPESLTVGLRDIGLDTIAYWDGNDLVLKQSLLNLSDEPVSFNAYCAPPGLARQERFFEQVTPGESAFQTYVFPNARHLAGQQVLLGIDEIGGPRNLNQFADVPQ